MAEYIDLDDKVVVTDTRGRERETTVRHILDMNKGVYTAADVIEVVRCKDCAWCHAGYCEKYDDLIPFGCSYLPWEDWFCADGKR